MKLLPALSSLIAGTIFGLGLAFSGMTDPSVVLSFLDPLGDWNYSLMFVMASAIIVTASGFRFIFKREAPILESQFFLANQTQIDKRLLAGSALFGIGWGIYGLCPGPAIAALSSLNSQALIFVVSMAVGMILTEKISKAIES